MREQPAGSADGEPAVHPLDMPVAGRRPDDWRCPQPELAERDRQAQYLGDVPDHEGAAQAVPGRPHRHHIPQGALARAHHPGQVEQPVHAQRLPPRPRAA